MGKICWINGQPYSVELPTGGAGVFSEDDQWSRFALFFAKRNDGSFHSELMFSWCLDGPIWRGEDRTIRGSISINGWNSVLETNQQPSIGFRPIFIPLDPNTLVPDPSLLEDIPDGQKIALTTLYLDDEPVKSPLKPIPNLPNLGLNGDIPSYTQDAKISFGDRDSRSEYWLSVIKYKELLWADRNILSDISWIQLEKAGFAEKEDVYIG